MAPRRRLRPGSSGRLRSGVAGALRQTAASLLIGALATGALVTSAAPSASAAETILPLANTVGTSAIVCADELHCLAAGSFGSTNGWLATMAGTTVSDAAALPTPGAGYQVKTITAFSCPTASTCYGVGAASDDGTAFGYVIPILYGVPQTPEIVPDVLSLSGIACQPGTTTCVAVGQATGIPGGFSKSGAVVQLSGGTEVGSAQQIPDSWSFTSIACETGTTSCLAVGQGAASTSSLLVGAVLPIDADTPGSLQLLSSVSQLTGIDCESATSCWAAGFGSGSGAVVQLTDEQAGTPVSEPALNETAGVSCPADGQCYATGRGIDPSSGSEAGFVLPITADVPATPDEVDGTSFVAAVDCPLVTQCVAAAQQPYNGDYEGVIVGDALPVPPAVITGATLSGSGHKLTVTITGTNFGDLQPTPTPDVPVSCAARDLSYDYPAGVLGFSDLTEGWSAGQTGDCIGVVINRWTDATVVLSFGSSYVYPLVQTGDAFSVSVLGATYGATAPTVTNPSTTVSSITVAGYPKTPVVRVTGSGFGTVPPWTDGSPGCTSPDKSQIYEGSALSFQDETSGWTAGEPGNCLGLIVTRWSNSVVVFRLGAYYTQLASIFNGDTVEVSILGSTGQATVSGLLGPDITGVAFSGLGDSPTTVTVTGTGLGVRPAGATHPGCSSTPDRSLDFPTSFFAFTDLNGDWTAGQAGDCVGVVVSSWTATSIVFTFGPQYLGYGPVASGDPFAVTVRGAEFQGVAS